MKFWASAISIFIIAFGLGWLFNPGDSSVCLPDRKTSSITFAPVAAPLGEPTPTITPYAIEISPLRLLALHNLERAKANLPELKLNDELTAAANLKASDMFEKNYFNHYSPDRGFMPVFAKEAGYDCENRYCGENLARNYSDPLVLMSDWMKSQSHREVILNPHYQDIGIAIKENLIVVLFGGSFAAPKP